MPDTEVRSFHEIEADNAHLRNVLASIVAEAADGADNVDNPRRVRMRFDRIRLFANEALEGKR